MTLPATLRMSITREIEESLAAVRARRMHPSRPDSLFHPRWEVRERTALHDVVVALLIRHGLPIDNDAATVAVDFARQAASSTDHPLPDVHQWAESCAQYVCELYKTKHATAAHEKTS